MNEHDINWPFLELRWVGEKDRYVWIYKQRDEDSKKDSRSKEPLKDLVGV